MTLREQVAQALYDECRDSKYRYSRFALLTHAECARLASVALATAQTAIAEQIEALPLDDGAYTREAALGVVARLGEETP